MNQRIRHIIDEARKLSTGERQDLLDLLNAEFGEDAAVGTPEEIAAAWDEEVARRIERVERGEGKLYDFDEVMAELRVQLQRR